MGGGFRDTSIARIPTQRQTPPNIAVVTALSLPRASWRDVACVACAIKVSSVRHTRRC